MIPRVATPTDFEGFAAEESAEAELRSAEAAGLIQAFLVYGGDLTPDGARAALVAVAQDRCQEQAQVWFDL